MGGSLYTRTWREGDSEEFGAHVFENHSSKNNVHSVNNRQANMQMYQSQREKFRNTQQSKRLTSSLRDNTTTRNLISSSCFAEIVELAFVFAAAAAELDMVKNLNYCLMSLMADAVSYS